MTSKYSNMYLGLLGEPSMGTSYPFPLNITTMA